MSYLFIEFHEMEMEMIDISFHLINRDVILITSNSYY